MDEVAKREVLARLRPIEVPKPWEAYLIPVSAMPVPDDERDSLRGVLSKLTTRAMQEWKLVAEVGLQVNQVHLEDGPDLLTKFGREWIPQLGLGVWPDREPPKGWTQEDFSELGMGERVRTLMFQVIRVSTTPEARDKARDIMFGIGAVMLALVPGTVDEYLDRARNYLLPPIKDSSFTCFPFYVPLLEGKSLQDVHADTLTAWMCGASVYIRESAEDNGVLIVSREPLSALLPKIGGQLDSDPSAGWMIPC